MKKILNYTFYSLLVISGLVFAVLNSEQVALDYYFGKLELHLSLIMIVSLFFGAVLGVVVSMGHVLKARREINKLKKAVQLAEKEVSNLRTIPVKDNH
ncbi:MAG: LapA family protein [Gammaproteobacteria bacterium]|nr:LapA family protein [Gammaproteobacteria bacterium]MDH5652094.1 LapA family protein [Gammaproteobacteria bacterium]